MGQNGLVHIYCGDGKGKTTAAMGLAVRCAGAGGKVLICQFLKDGKSSEIGVLKNTWGIEVMDPVPISGFVAKMSGDEREALGRDYQNGFSEMAARSDDYDMVVLDELTHAVNYGLLPLDMITGFIKNKPVKLEVVITGRNPAKELVGLADYVTEMKKVKHPFDKGIAARKMIEM